MSLGLSTGGTQGILGRPIGYLLSGTYSISQEVQADQVRRVAIAGSEPGSTVQADSYTGMTGRTGVLWGGLLNLTTSLGDRTKLSLNNAYNRTADNDARHETGASENLGLNLAIDRLRYVERAIRSTQLAAMHQLGDQTRLDWSATTSGVTRREPDRSEIVYARDEAEGGTYRWLSGSNEGAVRTFGDLAESSLEAGANLTLGLGPTASSPALKIGALARRTTREAETAAYSISAPGLAAEDRALAPEAIFDGRFAEPDDAVFRISPLSQGGSYEASDRLFAGYAMGDIGLGSKIRLVAGARARWAAAIEAHDTTTIRQLAIDRAEFAWLYYPASPFAGGSLYQSPELVWFRLQANSEKGIVRVLRRLGGGDVRYRAVACGRPPRIEGENRIWEYCEVRRGGGPGDRGEILFGGILEHRGRFKFVSYPNQF